MSFTSCTKDDTNPTINSTAFITAIDLRECASPCCGGYFIEIGSETYRFYEATLPENNLNLAEENLPLEVRLDWELADCGLITVFNIE